MRDNLPKIKKLIEIGNTPFQVIEVIEKVLQGWNNKKPIFLFKTDSGNWAYYDNDTKQVVDVEQWNGKSALVKGAWIKMGLYHKIHLIFKTPVTYTEYSGQYKGQLVSANEVSVNITDAAYKALESQMAGRPPNSFYQFTYKKGKTSQFVNGAIWVDPAALQI